VKTDKYSYVVHHVLHPGSPTNELARKTALGLPIARCSVAKRGDVQYRMGAVPMIMGIDRPRGHSIFVSAINATAASGSPVDSANY
jgi:hypothetical protein